MLLLWRVRVASCVVVVAVVLSLCGFPPFYGENDPQLYDMIKRGSFDMPDPFWTNISKSAKDLVTQLLQVEPAHRLTAEEVRSTAQHSTAQHSMASSGRSAARFTCPVLAALL